MNLLTARAGADLRQIHSRSFRAARPTAATPTAATPTAAARVAGTGLVGWLTRRLAQRRIAAGLKRELERLGDTALADLGLTRAGIPAHVRRAMSTRRRAGRVQSPANLSAHLLEDLAVQLRQGRARVYTDVPLGVITRSPAAGTPANVERARWTA